MTTAEARAVADDLRERALSVGHSVEHPETARLMRAVAAIDDLANQLDRAALVIPSDLESLLTHETMTTSAGASRHRKPADKALS